MNKKNVTKLIKLLWPFTYKSRRITKTKTSTKIKICKQEIKIPCSSPTKTK